MKKTNPLKVLCTARIPEGRLNIHPNEGADLGMMTTRYAVDLQGSGPAELFLLNECPKESLEMTHRAWEKIGRPKRVVLGWDGTVLKIEPDW